jgi:type I restriction enzyme S subunit
MNEPKLRFPEFKGEWEEKTLGEVSPVIFDGTHQTPHYVNSGIPFYSIENIVSDKPCKYIAQDEHMSNTKKNKTEKGDILITRIGTIGFAKIVDWDGEFSTYVSLATIKKSSLINTRYLLGYLQSEVYQKEMRSKSLMNAVPCKINMEDLKSTRIAFPKEQKEQQKIASCLSTIDDLIAAQAEKVEALKEKKTGMMQQLFPQPGETTPRLRFPEFTGEWEEKNINDCFEFKQGVQCPVDLQALQKKDGYIRFIRIIDLTQSGEPPRYIADPGLAHHICKEDLFMVRYGSPGLVGYGYEGVIANNLFRLLPKFDMCTKFFKDILTALHKNIAALCGIGALPAINFSTLGLLRISLPPTIAEQQKIADCLSALDDQIAAETEKLTALKEHKKGLMQQLFPQPAK